MDALVPRSGVLAIVIAATVSTSMNDTPADDVDVSYSLHRVRELLADATEPERRRWLHWAREQQMRRERRACSWTVDSLMIGGVVVGPKHR
jgi:hypothetical protein